MINIGEVNINDKEKNSLLNISNKYKEESNNIKNNDLIKDDSSDLPWRNGGNNKKEYYNKKKDNYYNKSYKNNNNYYNYNDNRNKYPLNQPKSKKNNKFD